MKQEVFCKFCIFYRKKSNFRYLSGKNTGTDLDTVCESPQNINKSYPPDSSKRYLNSPSVINKNHDCPWYIKRKNCNVYVRGSNNIVKKVRLGYLTKDSMIVSDVDTTEIENKIDDISDRVTKLENQIDPGGDVDEEKIVKVIEDRDLCGGTSTEIQ